MYTNSCLSDQQYEVLRPSQFFVEKMRDHYVDLILSCHVFHPLQWECPISLQLQLCHISPKCCKLTDNAIISFEENSQRSENENEQEVIQLHNAISTEAEVALAEAESASKSSKTAFSPRKKKAEKLQKNTSKRLCKPSECSICYEPCTKTGKHRLSALKCGHLFGKKCIERWIRERRTCPNCNVNIRKADVYPLYSDHIAVVDNSGSEELRQNLLMEKSRRLEAETELSRTQLQLQIAQNCVKEITAAKEYWRSLYSSVKSQLVSQQTQHSNLDHSEFRDLGLIHESMDKHLCKLENQSEESRQESSWKYREVSRHSLRQSRVFKIRQSCNAICIGESFSAASFGIKCVSTLDSGHITQIPVHQTAVRDLKISGDDELVLTTAFDGVLAVTDLRWHSVVARYKLPAQKRQGWSCSFSQSDSNIILCGFHDGTVGKYDLRRLDHRNTDEQNTLMFWKLPRRQPVHSLETICSEDGIESIMAATFNSCSVWRFDSSETPNDQEENQMKTIPFDGNCTSSSWTNNTILISTRTQKEAIAKHILYNLPPPSEIPDLLTPRCTLMGHSTSTMLCRSAIWKHQDRTLVASGDETSKSALIWDAQTKRPIHRITNLHPSQPVVDIHHAMTTGNRPNSEALCGFLCPSQLVMYAYQS
uniref:RING-type E3 ubiquitin transferase n=1 Tax=Albugo laibachii Nc14 TaxID=890382 RepID=F0X0G8_9STRA|nr:conserved hypothetical protein [Albugo laibachii Nc14]|eukprot:CCA27258.1 conserved hypothetical protein [Albugo laibachii Nc14]